MLPLPMPPPAPPSVDGMLATFQPVLDRIEAIVVAETEALSRRLPADVAAAAAQKRQGLLELSRLMRTIPAGGPPEHVRERLARLAVALDRNQAALEARLGAVREVADIVAKVMRDADSDGTYTLRSGWQ